MEEMIHLVDPKNLG